MINIILDPAHGKETPGKRSPDGAHREYKWSRDRCKSLFKKLTCLGYSVSYTNEGDAEIGIRNRKNIAEKIANTKNEPSLLISLHNDAFGESWTTASGYSVYTSPGNTKSDKFATILMDIFKKEFPNLRSRVDYSDKDSDKEQPFTVLMGKNYSAVLVEWLFQNNKKDLELINNQEYIQRFESCILKAIILWS